MTARTTSKHTDKCERGRESPPLNKQNMHRSICNNDKRSRDNRQADDIAPESERVKPESAQDRRAGDFDVEAVFVVNQGEEGHFVDD